MTRLNREYRHTAKMNIQEAARYIRRQGGVDKWSAEITDREGKLEELAGLVNQVRPYCSLLVEYRPVIRLHSSA